MGMNHQHSWQDRVAATLERIERLLIEQKDAQAAKAVQEALKPKRGRPPKARNGENVRD